MIRIRLVRDNQPYLDLLCFNIESSRKACFDTREVGVLWWRLVFNAHSTRLSMKRDFFRSLLAITFGITAFTQLSQGDRPEVLQVLSDLDRPVAAAFGPGGDTLFVANRSRGTIGALRNMGSLTKFTRSDDGSYKMASKRFVVGLTAPSAIDFAPISYADDLPAGVLFLVSGTPLIQNEDERMSKDVTKDFIGITVVDTTSGKILRKVNLSPAAPMKMAGEYSLISPNCLSFDKQGNLYIADTGIGGNMFMFKKQVQSQPAFYRISSDGIRQMLQGEAPTGAQVMKVTSIPSDMRYQESDDSLYFVANHIVGATKGAVFKAGSSGFRGQFSVQTLVRELDPLSSLVLLPNGKQLLISSSGELHIPRGKKASREIRFKPEVRFSTPGRVDLLPLADGTALLAVPEETGGAGVGKGQRVKIVKLPAKF